MSKPKHLFDQLMIDPDATYEEAKRSYFDYVKLLHPDKHHGDKLQATATEKTKRINTAWSELEQWYKKEYEQTVQEDEINNDNKNEHKRTDFLTKAKSYLTRNDFALAVEWAEKAIDNKLDLISVESLIFIAEVHIQETNCTETENTLKRIFDTLHDNDTLSRFAAHKIAILAEELIKIARTEKIDGLYRPVEILLRYCHKLNPLDIDLAKAHITFSCLADALDEYKSFKDDISIDNCFIRLVTYYLAEATCAEVDNKEFIFTDILRGIESLAKSTVLSNISTIKNRYHNIYKISDQLLKFIEEELSKEERDEQEQREAEIQADPERMNRENQDQHECKSNEQQKVDLTFLDQYTGLIWSTSGGLSETKLSWEEATKWVQNLYFAGHNDWRLPTLKELCDFVKQTGRDPYKASRSDIIPYEYFNSNGFNHVNHDCYWTSTVDEDDNQNAYRVSMICGILDNPRKTDKYYVWPVRCGEEWHQKELERQERQKLQNEVESRAHSGQASSDQPIQQILQKRNTKLKDININCIMINIITFSLIYFFMLIHAGILGIIISIFMLFGMVCMNENGLAYCLPGGLIAFILRAIIG